MPMCLWVKYASCRPHRPVDASHPSLDDLLFRLSLRRPGAGGVDASDPLKEMLSPSGPILTRLGTLHAGIPGVVNLNGCEQEAPIIEDRGGR